MHNCQNKHFIREDTVPELLFLKEPAKASDVLHGLNADDTQQLCMDGKPGYAGHIVATLYRLQPRVRQSIGQCT